MADTFVWEMQEMRKGIWDFFFLDCDFRVLIGWAGKLQSYEPWLAKRSKPKSLNK